MLLYSCSRHLLSSISNINFPLSQVLGSMNVKNTEITPNSFHSSCYRISEPYTPARVCCCHCNCLLSSATTQPESCCCTDDRSDNMQQQRHTLHTSSIHQDKKSADASLTSAAPEGVVSSSPLPSSPQEPAMGSPNNPIAISGVLSPQLAYDKVGRAFCTSAMLKEGHKLLHAAHHSSPWRS